LPDCFGRFIVQTAVAQILQDFEPHDPAQSQSRYEAVAAPQIDRVDRLLLIDRGADQLSEPGEILFDYVTVGTGLCCQRSKLVFVVVGHDDDPRK
jgi:hypothetical protein